MLTAWWTHVALQRTSLMSKLDAVHDVHDFVMRFSLGEEINRSCSQDTGRGGITCSRDNKGQLVRRRRRKSARQPRQQMPWNATLSIDEQPTAHERFAGDITCVGSCCAAPSSCGFFRWPVRAAPFRPPQSRCSYLRSPPPGWDAQPVNHGRLARPAR